MDYLLDDPSYEQNGFIELIRLKIGIPNNEMDYMAPTFTGEICKWIHDNKKKICDYQFVDKYLLNKNGSS
jgi:hypothetical protein